MSALLESTRKINRLLQQSRDIDYGAVSRVLRDVIGANVYIVGRRGNVRGYAFRDDFECAQMIDKVISCGQFPERYVGFLLGKPETSANLYPARHGLCVFSDEQTPCPFPQKNTTIVPIYSVGERIGTLIVAKYDGKFSDDDLLLAEYSAAIVGIRMLRDYTRRVEVETRERTTVQCALAALSYSEQEAAIAIFSELEGDEAMLVASKIADRVGITRSVIVNALRKFKSAGVIDSKSLGMKGTYIKVLNEHLREEIQRLRSSR